MFNKTQDFIRIYDNALSSDQCKEMIEWIDQRNLGRGVLGANPRIDLDSKDDWEVGGEFTNFENNHIATQYLVR